MRARLFAAALAACIPAAVFAQRTPVMKSSTDDLRRLMAGYRERRKTDIADALVVFPEAQKRAATGLLGQQDGDLDKLLGGRP
jgi:hypothetical protein